MDRLIADKFTLLFVDDEESILSALKRVFFKADYILHAVNNGEDALARMAETEIHAALIDLRMPGLDGLSLLKKVKDLYPHIMVVVLTGHGSIQNAVEAIKTGAVDFIEKPFISESLVARIQQLSKIWQLGQENQRLKNEMGFRFKYEKFIGNSSKALGLKKMISQVGPSDATVLIQGETGTGKELVAKAIHHHSARLKCGFVVVDCATISETMLESELFGHVKGAFTGAYAETKGLVRAAHKGTLFFDEIGELPLQVQAKLLRLIQEREIRPVGSNKSVKVDIRILAATNRDLKTEIRKNRFREDLYYRLDTVMVKVPPLRERIEDIDPLTDHFLKKLKTDFSVVEAVSKEALTYMEKYQWPGNIRELENVIRRVMALSSNTIILPEDLPETINNTAFKGFLTGEDSLEAYEKAAIKNALRKSNNHRKKASQILEIGEATLYRKIRKYWPNQRQDLS